MSLLYQDWTKARIAPMSELWLLVDTSTVSVISSELIIFKNPEADSSWSLEPITQATSKGGERIVAFKLSVTAHFAYNNFEDMREALQLLTQNTIKDQELKLAPASGQRGGGVMAITLDADLEGSPAIYVRDYSVKWSIESVEFRPRLTIQTTGIYGRNAIAVETHGLGIFTQSSGW